MAIYSIAIAIAVLCFVPTQAHVVVHPKAVPNSYENTKTIQIQDIKKRQFLSQTIQKNSAAYVQQTGFQGQLSTVSFRGLPATHTLVLLDGIPLNGSSSGLFDFSILQSKSIDSVEIIPGSSSVLYGANATGGVIDLTSHQAVKNQKFVQFEGGAFKTLNGYIGLDHIYDSGNYTVYTEGYRTDGLPKYEKKRIPGERNKTSNLGGGAFLNHSFRKADLAVFLKGAESNLKYDASLSDIPSKPISSQYRNINLMGAKVTTDSDNYQCHHEFLTARFNDYKNHRGSSFSDHTKHYGTYNLSYYGIEKSESHFLVSGDHEKLKQDNNFNKEIINIGTALSHNYRIFQNLSIDFGIRNDYHKLYHHHQTYSSGLNYHINQTTFYASYRTGFRPPSLYRLYYENDFTQSNQNLKPEKSGTIESGFKTHFSQNYDIHVSCYQSKTRNFIIGKKQNNGKWQGQNIGGTTVITGIDFNQTLHINTDLDFSLGYALTNFDRNQTGVSSGNPRHKVNGLINWKIYDDLHSQVSALWVSDRKSTKTVLRNYTLFDFNLTKHLSHSSQIYLKINNVFDERYTSVINFRSPRREVYVGTILTF